MNTSPLAVRIGVFVELELLSEEAPERLLVEIVPDAQADFYHGYLGVNTPLAQAMLGEGAGALVSYQMGEVHQIRILDVRIAELGLREARANTVARQEELEEARKEIDKSNAIAFATAVDNKWGAYDPDGIDW